MTYRSEELAASMLGNRTEGGITAKQAKFLQSVIAEEIRRDNPSARLGWRDLARMQLSVNGRPYLLIVNWNGGGALIPEVQAEPVQRDREFRATVTMPGLPSVPGMLLTEKLAEQYRQMGATVEEAA